MNPVVILIIGVVLLIGMILVLRLNAFVALITSAMVISLLSPGDFADKIARVGKAFGGAAGNIGIVIAMAAIIGKCMMDSGAADRIVRSFLKVLGEKRAATALMLSGFVLSVPVFFDTVFYLLVPLARSLWGRTHKNYMLYVTAIVAGAAITHTLVPPTPGPLLMASELKVDVGLMMIIGLLIGLPTAALGVLVCKMINRRMDIPMRPYAGQAEPELLDDNQLPPFWISFAPIALPIILISLNTVTNALNVGKPMSEIAAVLGHRDSALVLAAAVAMFVLVRQRKLSFKELASRCETALMSGGMIILITAAGGAFGAMLREAGIKALLQELLGVQGGSVMLLMAFAVAVVMKFAQGSGTVSMITTVSIFAAMGISPTMLGCNPVYLAMAIGSGSLVGDWMNNSGFWIFARMGGFTEIETLKSWTILTAALGVIGLGFTLLFAYLLPMMPAA
ncbi:MAG: gluconate permease [Planctomycetes bacterium]|nr:gluconate permease [Planctomycetota bacterium]MBL7143469.1 gluconate permease [Phycisphaerae bacterium]